jgi:L-ascorbate metabolism protein UlaG (beta-lactamase superfamily)
MTWWGGACVELQVADRCVVVDPFLHPTEPRANYIFITHADYDHCHEPTLRRLVIGANFHTMLAPPSCPLTPRLDAPLLDAPPPAGLSFVRRDQLVVMYPKFARSPRARYPGPTELLLGDLRVEAIESSEKTCRYKPADGTIWPAGTGRYVGDDEFPNLGYLITDERTDLTYYHPGDLHEVFDSHRALRGRVHYMFFPLSKLQGLELTIVDVIRPRVIIPIHFRTTARDFPIPPGIAPEDVPAVDFTTGAPRPGVAPSAYRTQIHAMMAAHWYPGPNPYRRRIDEVTPALKQLGTTVHFLRAGRRYRV